MSQIVPLIRAAALMPVINWMIANNRPINSALKAADLSHYPMHDASRELPHLNVAALLRDLARQEGPDIGVRAVSTASVADLGVLGRAALGAKTPREALQRVASAMSRHCTHEHIVVAPAPSAIEVRDFWTYPFDDEELHLIQQYVAALVSAVCAPAAREARPLARVELIPHPEFGLDHLCPWFGPALVPGDRTAMMLAIDNAVADRRFPGRAREDAQGLDGNDWPVLRGRTNLASSARLVIRVMLEDGSPTVDRLAMAAGLSVRTLQRRLADEGTCFSDILDAVRREVALQKLVDRTEPAGSLSELANTLAYTRQSALTRSVQRWTGQAPSRLRRAARALHVWDEGSG